MCSGGSTHQKLYLSFIFHVYPEQEKVKTIQLRRKYAPWIDDSVKKMIERKKILYEIWKRTENQADWKEYIKQSNYIVKVIKQKKTSYMKQSLRLITDDNLNHFISSDL